MKKTYEELEAEVARLTVALEMCYVEREAADNTTENIRKQLEAREIMCADHHRYHVQLEQHVRSLEGFVDSLNEELEQAVLVLRNTAMGDPNEDVMGNLMKNGAKDCEAMVRLSDRLETHK
jgi:chromosome segregation ATPase